MTESDKFGVPSEAILVQFGEPQSAAQAQAYLSLLDATKHSNGGRLTPKQNQIRESIMAWLKRNSR